jgi:transforming growth factor-beta-induced protein
MKKVLVSLVAAISLLFVLAQDMPATVVDIAVGSPDHTTLVAAVTQAGLVETLSGEGPFTVFAPTDAAFEAALADMGITAEDLLANPDLASILTYHVVAGKLLAADVLAAVEAGGGTASVETVNGAPIEVTVADGVVTLNGTATVTVADLEAGNGVVHVIDGVIMPPAQ